MKRASIALFALLAWGLGVAQSTVDMQDRTIAEILEADPELSISNAMFEAAGLEEVLSSEGPYTLFVPTDHAWTTVNGRDVAMMLDDPELLRSVMLYHVVSGEATLDRLLEMLAADGIRRSGGDRDEGEVEEGDPVAALLATGVTAAVAFATGEGSELEIVAVRTNRMHEAPRAREGKLLGSIDPVQVLVAEGVDLMVGDARVVAVDIVASNGIIHFIDRVLAPEDVDLLR